MAHSAKRREMIANQQTEEAIRLQPAHRLLPTARQNLSTAASPIAASISSIVTVRVGLGNRSTRSLNLLGTGAITVRLSSSAPGTTTLGGSDRPQRPQRRRTADVARRAAI